MMSPAERESEREHFESLLLLDAGARRSALEDLRRADPGLAERLAGLLSSDERSGALDPVISLRAEMPARAAARLLADGESVSTTVGRVRVDRLLSPIRPPPAAQVYRVRGDSSSEFFVLKVWETETLDPALLRRLRIESRALALLKHPGVIPAIAAGPVAARGAVDRRLIGVMTAYAEGRHLDDWARGRSARDIGVAFAALARTVAFVHGRGVLHRDLKPSNVIVTPQGRPVILDLGMARLLRTEREERLSQSSCLTVAGTLRYMAPEQLTPALAAVDERADVYALGVMLWELLTEGPFLDLEGLTEAESFLRKTSALPRAPGGDSYRDRLLRIARAAADGDAAERYGSAARLAAAIEAAAEGSDRPIRRVPRDRSLGWRSVSSAAGTVIVALLIASSINYRTAAPASGPHALPTPLQVDAHEPERFASLALAPFTIDGPAGSRRAFAEESLRALREAAELTDDPSKIESIGRAYVLLGESIRYSGLDPELAAAAFDGATSWFDAVAQPSLGVAADAAFARQWARRLAPSDGSDADGEPALSALERFFVSDDTSAVSLRRRAALRTAAARDHESRGELLQASALAALAVADCERALGFTGAGSLDLAQLVESAYLLAEVRTALAPADAVGVIESASSAALRLAAHRPDLCRLWLLRIEAVRAVRLAGLGDHAGFIELAMGTMRGLEGEPPTAPVAEHAAVGIRAAFARACIPLVRAGDADAIGLAQHLLSDRPDLPAERAGFADPDQDLTAVLVFVELGEALREVQALR